jgi:hypothetical protein
MAVAATREGEREGRRARERRGEGSLVSFR